MTAFDSLLRMLDDTVSSPCFRRGADRTEANKALLMKGNDPVDASTFTLTTFG